MPDVGVLQLKISADASAASKSLKTLQTRLSEINELAKNFDVSNVSTQIGNIVNTVKGDKGVSTAVKNLGALLNAIAAFSKVTKIGLSKAQINQISALQVAVSGFNLGQSGTQLNKLREALGGEWNTDQAEKAKEAMEAISQGAKAVSEKGSAGKIKETAESVKSMTVGTASELKTASNEMKTFGQETGRTAQTLERIGMMQGSRSIFGNMARPFMSMQGSALNETAGFAESTAQIKEVSVLAKDATTDMQGLKEATSEVASTANTIDVSKMTHEVEQAASYMGLADKDIASAVNGMETVSRAAQEQTDAMKGMDAGLSQKLQNIEVIADTWKSMSKDEKYFTSMALQKDPLISSMIEKMSALKGDNLDKFSASIKEIISSSVEGKEKLQQLYDLIQNFGSKTNTAVGAMNSLAGTTAGIGNAGNEINGMAQSMQRVAEVNVAPAVKEQTQAITSATSEATSAMRETASHTKEVQTANSSMASSMRNSKSSVMVLRDGLKDLDHELKEKKTDLNETGEETKKLSERFMELMFGTEGLKGSMKRLFPTITGLLSRFKQLVKYRMLRAIIKQISEGFREGYENYYHYSEAIGSGFAPSMDSATSSLLQMKNSIGAAVAPLMQSLVPVLQTVVNWFITLINYANQFIALLRGQSTWSRAVPTTAKTFKTTEKAAKGASSAMKDLLADWDELNIIQSQGGGGGGSGTGADAMTDYLNMFEEVSEFDNDVKKIVDYIKDNFDDILYIAGAIGTAILGWKISNAFKGWIGALGTLASAVATVYLSLKLTDEFGKQYANTGEPGWLIADALAGGIGPYLAGKAATKLLGASAGQITAGITLIIEGFINVKNAVSAMEQQNEGAAWAMAALGSIEAGIGTGLALFGLHAGGPVSLIAGATVAAGTFLISIPLLLEAKRVASYKEMAQAAFSATGKNGISPADYIAALQKELDNMTAGSHLIVDIFSMMDQHQTNFKKNIEIIGGMNYAIKNGLSAEDAQRFKEAWDIVITEMNEMEHINFDTIYTGLNEVITSGSETLSKKAEELMRKSIEIAGMMGGARGAMEEELRLLTNTITAGTASDEDIKRYSELYKIMAETTDSGLDTLKKSLEEGTAFDFGEENAVGNALEFIKNLSTQQIEPALQAVQEKYDVEIAAIEAQKKELEKLWTAGYIDDEEYKKGMQAFDLDETIFNDWLKEQKKKIAGMTDDAYETIISQVIGGIGNMDSTDEYALKSYAQNVMKPLFDAIEEAGYEIPDYAKIILDNMTAGGNLNTDIAQMANNYSRASIYEGFANDDTIENPMAWSLSYEIDLVGQNLDAITDEAKKEIINAFVQTFGDMPQTFEMLSGTFGWSYDDIFGNLDISNYTPDELADLLDTIQKLTNDNEADLSLPDVTRPGLEEEADATATIYENMVQRIKETFGELDGLGFNVSGAESGGIKPMGVLASAGVSDVGGPRRNYAPNSTFTLQVEPGDNQQEVNNTANGVRQGTETLLSALNSILSVAQAINRKQFVVNLVPTSGLGRTVAQGAAAFSRVTGV